MRSSTEPTPSASAASSCSRAGGTRKSVFLAVDSISTSAASSSSQPVGGGVSASARQEPPQHVENGNQTIGPRPCLHNVTGDGGHDIDDAFKPESPVSRAQGLIAAPASTNPPPIHVAPVLNPEYIADEEMASSSHARIDWPDSQDSAWANRVIQDVNTEPSN